MAKLRGPLLSISAAGTVGRCATYVRQPRGQVAQLRALPGGAPTEAQRSVRAAFGRAALAWHGITTAERNRWTALAATRGIEPRRLFTAQYILQTIAAPNIPRLPNP